MSKYLSNLDLFKSKGFFNRSLNDPVMVEKYKCQKELMCVINKNTRKDCRYCRLQKCQQVGLSNKGNFVS